MDPIHQFEIKNLLPIIHIGGTEIAFTNSALFMLIALALIVALMLGATRSRALVPGRLQAVAEMSYEFVATTLRSSAGSEGMKFFPLVFSLFMIILVMNVIGIIPYTFTVTLMSSANSIAPQTTAVRRSGMFMRSARAPIMPLPLPDQPDVTGLAGERGE